MSEFVKRINAFFKEATKIDVQKIEDELILDETLTKIFKMFYLQKKSIFEISSILGFSQSKIKQDLKLIRKKLSKLL